MLVREYKLRHCLRKKNLINICISLKRSGEDTAKVLRNWKKCVLFQFCFIFLGSADGPCERIFKVSWYPKMDHFFKKYAFIIFRQILFKPLLYKKCQRKRSFLRKDMDEKRLGPLISSNYVLTVICQQRLKCHMT